MLRIILICFEYYYGLWKYIILYVKFSIIIFTDSDTLPTMNLLQNGLLNVGGESLEDFNAFITHLVKFALDDPGVASPKDVSLFCDSFEELFCIFLLIFL